MSKIHTQRAGFITKYPPSTPTINGANVVISGNGISGAADLNPITDPLGNIFYKSMHPVRVAQGHMSGNMGYSIQFNGTNEGLCGNNPGGLTFGTGDFTIECWIKSYNWSLPTTLVYLWNTAPNGVNTTSNIQEIYIASGTISYRVANVVRITAGSAMSSNTWYHIALVRASGVTKLYLNGTQTGASYTDTNNYTCSDTNYPRPLIGSDFNNLYSTNSNSLFGLISNLRVMQGVAVYTGNFSAPTLGNLTGDGASSAAAYPSTTNVNTSFTTPPAMILSTGIDGTPYWNDTSGQSLPGPARITTGTGTTVGNTMARSAITAFSPYTGYSGSNYFYGQYDGIEYLSNAAYGMGSSSFTIECWVYLPNLGSAATVFDFRTSILDVSPSLTISTIGVVSYVTANTTRIQSNTGGVAVTLSAGVWYHIAVVKTIAVTRMYINGVNVGATYNDTNTYVTNRIRLGADYTGTVVSAAPFYMTDFRVVKGTAVYSGGFTPPIAPLANSGAGSASSYSSTTNVDTSFASSNCVALLNFTRGNGLQSEPTPSYNPKPVVVNGVTVNTSIYKFGGGSMYFGSDGKGSSIYVPGIYNLGTTTNFTIEGWFYFTSVAGNQVLWSVGSNNNTSVYPMKFYIYNGTSLVLSTAQNNNFASYAYNFGTLSPSITINNWVHIAVTRNSGTITCWVNGQQFGSTQSNSLALGATYGIWLGGPGNTFEVWPQTSIRGYVDDFRASIGSALYTTAFVPPGGENTSTTLTPGSIGSFTTLLTGMNQLE